MRKPLLAAVALVAAALAQASPIELAGAAPEEDRSASRPTSAAEVRTASDADERRIHPRLRERAEAGATGSIPVYVTVTDPTDAVALLEDPKVAFEDGAGIVLGRVDARLLPKLAGAPGVVAVGSADVGPAGMAATDEHGSRFGRGEAGRVAALRAFRSIEVPYASAPPLAGSSFEAQKANPVLDPRTHRFADAWNAGFTGAGVSVGILDSGIDFGHPDLIGTWDTWSGLTGARAGWNGWPKAFDTTATLHWLFNPDAVDLGYSWHTMTTRAACPGWSAKPAATCAVTFATRTGPDRVGTIPAGTVQRTYRFPASMTKSGTVRLGSHPDDHLLYLFGERPAFLVTDPNLRGVYDTIYVDLDNDHRFDDEKPVTKSSPVSYRDMNGDGFTDLSGGLVYHISDGATPIPGGLDAFGILDSSHGPGELVAWTGEFDPHLGGHGTIVASNVAGQGVANGLTPRFSDLPGGTLPGAVIGGAPHAKLVSFGNVLYNEGFFELGAQLGYFLATRRGVDVTNSSFAHFSEDADGWDVVSQEIDVMHRNRRTTSVFLTANSGPGFGTATAPNPSTGIRGGASTQFGGTGWDSIDRSTQITDNDIIPFSGRGFAANGSPGVDLVANGAFGPSDMPLNWTLHGRYAWWTVGGTSRSGPVIAGATALVYQAWRAANGPLVPAGFYDRARAILKSSAVDLGYDSTVQGSGSLDAAAAVETALGDGPRVAPTEWRAGSYRGTDYPVFAHLVAPGERDSQTFTVDGLDASWSATDRQLVRTDVETFSFSSAQLSKESAFNHNAPDYLMDLGSRVEEHPDADLLTVRIRYPHEQFDANGDYRSEQQWSSLLYSWTDSNGDGDLWSDADSDGVVDHRNLTTSGNIDWYPDLDWSASEIDRGEYVRFNFHRADGNQLTVSVRDPHDRMADGLFLGLQHVRRSAGVPVTDFEVELSWHTNEDWDWLTTSDPSAGAFEAAIDVPTDAAPGMYSGAVVLSDGDDSIVVPVSVAVPATAPQDADGAIDGQIDLGGEHVADAQRHLAYNNGSVFGAGHWIEREPTGDWRFYFFDLAQPPPPGSALLTRTSWQSAAPYTDIDTLVLGAHSRSFRFLPDATYGAPYVLDVVGRSPDLKVARGIWRFHTSTGGAEDLVTAPAQEGLHEIALHQVGWDGDRFDAPFSVAVGSLHASPSSIELEVEGDSGSADVTLNAGLPLDGLLVEGFGLGQSTVTTEVASQDDWTRPSSASIKRDITLEHASRLLVSTALGSDDIDLFLVRDDNEDGVFTEDEIVAVSGGFDSDELIELDRPADGDYQVWVHGFDVSGAPELELTIEAPQGHGIDVDAPEGPIAADVPITLTVAVSGAMTSGERYIGELLLGPPSDRAALRVPISVHRR